MMDQEFARSVKRYLERRGGMSGDALFRTRGHAGDTTAPHRPVPEERLRKETGRDLAGGIPEQEAAGGIEVAPSGRPGGIGELETVKGEVGSSGPKRAGSESPPPIRRVYVVKGSGKETPKRAQTDLFGEEPALPETSDLAGLDLDALEERVSACTLCPLCEGRNRTVFGSGDPRAKIVFIGEAPGREEDIRGEPFVGRAGQLLTKILASVGFTREEVYITNILKCRPPENRDPNEKEVRACKPYLKRQIELLEPVLICALGRIAGQNLLERNASLSVMRQHIHYYENVRTIVTYHPAALLRNPNLKRAAWDDIQETRRIYTEALKDT
jgi:uracil-DNA glycosylase family 4